MVCDRENGFLTGWGPAGADSIGIESSRIDECVAEIQRRRVKSIFGAPYLGFEEDTLDFLRQIPFVERMWFNDVKVRDIDGLYSVAKLKFFGVFPKRPGIDFSKLPDLEELIIHFNKRDIGIDSLTNVKRYHVWHFNPKKATFERLLVPPSVQKMMVCWANPHRLDGLSSMPKLKQLELARCRNLTSVGALPSIAPKLEEFMTEDCGRLDDGERVARSMRTLKHCFIGDTEIVSKYR
tara:strand:+ start:27111 stop:27821 length:711 start_codon:yes stop_codon:yes gene_type:complete